MNDREKQINELANHIKRTRMPLSQTESEILADVLYMLGYRKEQAENDDEGIYLIYTDSMDDYGEHVGYIKGTEEKANEYCRKHNEKQKHRWNMVESEKLCNLEDVQTAEDHPAVVDRVPWEAAAQAENKGLNERKRSGK